MKRVLWILLAVVAAAILALCAAIALSGAPAQFVPPAASPVATAVPIPTPTPVPTPAPTPVEYAGVLREEGGVQTYYFQNYALVIPKAWEGKFDYETSEDGVAFFSKSNREAGNGGLLCWIAPTMVMRPEDMESLFDGIVLGEQDGCYYLMTVPIDRQYNAENKVLTAEYEEMQGAMGLFAASFAFTDGEPE